MRARNIKPGILSNETLAELGPYAYILFTGLWMLADREGRLEDRPKHIRALAMPLWDEVSTTDVEILLEKLWENDFIHRYEVAGQGYIQVTNWHKHQNPHPRETASIIPPPPREMAPVEPLPPDSSLPSPAESASYTKAVPRPVQGNGQDMSSRADSLDLLIPDPRIVGGEKSSNCSEENGIPAADKNQGKNPPQKQPPAAAKTSTQVEAVSTQVAPVRKLPAREEQPPQDGPQQSEDLSILRQSLDSLAGELHMQPPDDVILHSIFTAGHGATEMQIHEAIKALYHKQRFRSMYSWGLLPLVISQCFGAQPRARAS